MKYSYEVQMLSKVARNSQGDGTFKSDLQGTLDDASKRGLRLAAVVEAGGGDVAIVLEQQEKV